MKRLCRSFAWGLEPVWLLYAGVAMVLVSLLSAPASAQIVDYRSLQDMLGEPVTISGTGVPQRVADAPVMMEIITAEDIRRSGVDNVPDILARIAGVTLRRYGATDADIGIRGYDAANSARVLVLVNGRQIYVDYHSYTAWAILPVQLEEIRQIEVIKGPNSALLGFNAVGGVINIVTFDPIFDPINQVSLRGGSQADRQISAIGGAAWSPQAGLRLSAGEHLQDEPAPVNQPPSYGPFPDHAFNRTAYAEARVELPVGVSVLAEADGETAKQFEMTVGGFPGGVAYSANHQRVGMDGLSPIGDINLTLYRNEVDFSYFPGNNCITCITISNQLWVTQASDIFKIGPDHILRVGLEYRSNQVGGSSFASERLGMTIAAANALWHWQVTPDLSVNQSVRLDHLTFSFVGAVAPGVAYSAAAYNSRPITETSLNSALVYRPYAEGSLRLSLARAVQPPDFYASFPEPVSNDPNFAVGTVASFQGTPDLKPTIVTNLEADYQHRLTEQRLSVQLALYFQTSRDVLASPADAGVVDPATDFGYAGNIGRSRAFGGEVSAKGELGDGWRWRIGDAWTFISDHLSINPDPALPDSSVDNQRGTPRQTLTFGLGHSIGDWEMDLSGHWQSAYSDIAINLAGAVLVRTPIKDDFGLDTRVAYRIRPGLTAALSSEQINQAKSLQTAGPPVQRRWLGSLVAEF